MSEPTSPTSDQEISSDAGAPQVNLNGKKILIIEDEAFVAMALETAFEAVGSIVVGPAATLAEAINLSENADVDVAIVDIDLNGLDVFPAADILVKRNIPFLFQTGHGQRRELGADYPDVPVCKKPISRKDLIAAVTELV